MTGEPAGTEVRITMIRCSTVLIEWRDLAILADPWFGMHMRGLPCFRRPGRRPEDLPPIDAVLASHLHPDHWDEAAIDRLAKPPGRVLLPPSGRAHVRLRPGVEYEELTPWTSTRLGPATVTAVPGPHTFPPPDEINYVVDLPDWGRLFFGGDARYLHNVLAAIAMRFKPIRLALLPVGGTRILGRQTTMGPREALSAAALLGADKVLPIHEGGIWLSVPPLSLHPGRASHLKELFRRRDEGDRVVVLREGESVCL